MEQESLRKKIAYAELSLAMIIVGSSVVVGKLVIADFPIFLASGLSLLVATIVILPIQFIAKKGLPKLIKKDFFYLLLQALFGLFLFRVFILYGLKLTGAIEAGIITSTTPVWIALIAFVFLKEKIGLPKGIGIILSIVGVVFINILQSSFDAELTVTHFLGNVLVVGAVIGEALFTIFRKSISDKIDAISGATFVILFGFVLFLPFAIYESINFSFSDVTTGGWISVIYYGATVTVLAFILWFDGVTKVETSTAGVFTALMPISAMILSSLVLGEQIYWFHGLGIVLVLAGIFLSIESFTLKENKLIAIEQ